MSYGLNFQLLLVTISINFVFEKIVCRNWTISIYKNESVCVCVYVRYARPHAWTKFDTVKFWAQGQVFNASSTPPWLPPPTWLTGPSRPRSALHVEHTENIIK